MIQRNRKIEKLHMQLAKLYQEKKMKKRKKKENGLAFLAESPTVTRCCTVRRYTYTPVFFQRKLKVRSQRASSLNPSNGKCGISIYHFIRVFPALSSYVQY